MSRAPFEAPVLQVVRGNPSSEELAALVVVLAARGGSPAEGRPAQQRWASPAARLRSPAYGRSPGGWRASALPR
ncbi:MAG: acyl-CoA carboxylase subunit epsilon [Actinomycetota bacterium]|nr:acyl-CoA carboxylase subunit epsilon [Actinomycetota bacterium]